MDRLSYLDFDLLIDGSRGDYRVRVIDSPAGETTASPFRLPFSDLELEEFRRRVTTSPQRWNLDDSDLDTVKGFGWRLYEALFDDQLRECLGRSLDRAAGDNAGLRIRLRLTDAPDLVGVPWEFLYNESLNRFLCLSAHTPVVRYLELPESVRPFTVEPPLGILVLVSSPNDYPPLDVARELANLHIALRGLEETGRARVDAVERPTLEVLQTMLATSRYHVLHFIGHGGFDAAAEDGVLAFEDDDGRGLLVSGQRLGTLLHDHRALRLAVLNSCEGARTDIGDAFAGTAQSLVQQGVPAVVAMQFRITDPTAITFSRSFYQALVEGPPVDAALAEARKAIFAEGNPIEWATPVLYLRAADGRIVDLATGDTRSAPTPVPAPAPATPETPLAAPMPSRPTSAAGGRRTLFVAIGLILAAAAAFLWMTRPDDDVEVGADPPSTVTSAGEAAGDAAAGSQGQSAESEESFDIAVGDVIAPDQPGVGAGVIESPAASDVYRFTGEAGDRVFVDGQSECSVGYFTLSLRVPGRDDPLSEVLWYGCYDVGPIELDATGDFELVVTGFEDDTGRYQLRLWDVPDPESFDIAVGDAIAPDQPGVGAGVIESPAASDVYRFTGEAGDRVFVDGQSECSVGYFTLSLRVPGRDDPLSEVLWYGCYDVGPIELDATGDFELVVTGFEDDTGRYRLSLVDAG